MSQQFTYVGQSTSATSQKISWPNNVQAEIIRANMDGKSAKQAFEVGRVALGLDELPRSYTNKNAGSLLHGMRQRFLKRCNKGDTATIAAAMEAGLIQAVEQQDEPTEEEQGAVDLDYDDDCDE